MSKTRKTQEGADSLDADKKEIAIPLEADEKKLNDIVDQYQQEKAEKVKTPRKRKETAPEENKQADEFAGTATIAVHIALDMLMSRMPKPVPLSNEEKSAFDTAFTQVARKYYSTVQRFGEELNFALILGFIVVARLDFNKKEEGNTDDNGTDNTNIRKDGTGQKLSSEGNNEN